MPRRPSVAAITVVRDEAVMLPLWVAHYGERLGLDHLVVLDDHTTDGSTTGLEVEVRSLEDLPGGEEFELARLRVANRLAAELLERFDWVVFTDADEFLLPDPDRGLTLPELLGGAGTPAVAPYALNVVHDLEGEAPLDATRPVLDQRSFAYFASIMCKPSMKRRPAAWRLASHGISCPYEVTPSVFMLHLKFADAERLAVTSRHRNDLHAEDGRGGGSWQREGVPEMFEARMREVDFAAAPEFDPTAIDPATLVQRSASGRAWRTRKGGNSQLRSLREAPVVRIPQRLRGHF